MGENENLPYTFVLFYDIKTKQELVDELDFLQTRLDHLKSLIEDYGVDLSGIVPTDC
jgi:hypothetical protein